MTRPSLTSQQSTALRGLLFLAELALVALLVGWGLKEFHL